MIRSARVDGRFFVIRPGASNHNHHCLKVVYCYDTVLMASCVATKAWPEYLSPLGHTGQYVELVQIASVYMTQRG